MIDPNDMADQHQRQPDRHEPAPESHAREPQLVGASGANRLLEMQSTAGNQSVIHFLDYAQAKLAVGAADDPLEHEADRVADEVVRSLRRSSTASAVGSGLDHTARLGVRRVPLRSTVGAEGGAVEPDVEHAISSARGAGRPLSDTVRRQMEGAFGADLGGVRIHTGTASARLNRKLQARAFTVGSDIFFDGTAPDTSSAGGQHLLAHELAHTVQQGAVDSVQRTPAIIQRKRKTDAQLLKGELPPIGDPDRARAIKLRIQAGNQRRAAEKKQQTMLGWLGSWLPGSFSYSAAKEEDDDDDDDGGPGFESAELASGEGGASVAEVELGDQEPEEEDEPANNPFAPSEIVIQLAHGSIEHKDTRVGDVKAKGAIKATGGGAIRGEGSASVEGSKGKAAAELKVLRDADGMEGDGKVEFLIGGTGERKSGTLAWDIAGGTVEGDGQLEGFAGAKGELSAKGKVNTATGEFSAKGKAGGMVGMGTEGTVNVRIKTGEKDLGSVEGKLGMHYGVGGEIFGTIEFKGSTLTFSSGGKLVAGMGFSYAYKVEMNTQALLEVGAGWTSALWNWMTDTEGLTEEDFWL